MPTTKLILSSYMLLYISIYSSTKVYIIVGETLLLRQVAKKSRNSSLQLSWSIATILPQLYLLYFLSTKVYLLSGLALLYAYTLVVTQQSLLIFTFLGFFKGRFRRDLTSLFFLLPLEHLSSTRQIALLSSFLLPLFSI